MHRFVAAADGAGLEVIRFAVGAADESAGFANQEGPSRNIPGIEAPLPKGVKAAGGDLGEIKGGAANPADIDDPLHHRRKLG